MFCVSIIADLGGNDMNVDQSILTEIPQGILNEIKLHHDNVTVDLNSDATETTKSYKLAYREISDELTTAPIMDPKTFEIYDVTGYSAKCFLARLDILEDVCIIRRVLSIGNVIVPPENHGK